MLCYPSDVPKGEKVVDLEDTIRVRWSHELKDEELFLFKCAEPEKPKKTRRDRVMIWLRQNSENDDVQMEPSHHLQKYFCNGPAPEDDEKIDIIVATRSILGGPGAAASRKRPRPLSQDDVETRHKKALQFTHNTATPSSAADPRIMHSEQEKYPIFNGRPDSRCGSPISIYHEAFARLKDDLAHLDTIKVMEGQLQTTYKLFTASAELCKDEEVRIKETREHWGSLLGVTIRRFTVDGGTAHGDGGVIVEPQVGVCALVGGFEWKAELGSNGDAGFQASCTYRKFIAQPTCLKIHSSTCSPCLLIGIMGPYFCVMGAVFVDEVIVEPFTEWIFLGVEHHGRITTVARILKATADTLCRLKEFYLSVELNDEVNLQAYLPSPTVRDGSEQPHPLRYISRLFPDKLSWPLYFAKMDNCDVIVKFTYQYCKEEHELLARECLAPELFFCDRICGGLYMVVMDYIEDATHGDSSPATLSSGAYLDVKKAIGLLHAKDLVFRDLRRPNIIVVKKKTQNDPATSEIWQVQTSTDDERQGDAHLGALLIDFDWCGEDSKAKYPDTLDDTGEIKWANGVGRGRVMRKEHDLFSLQTLMK